MDASVDNNNTDPVLGSCFAPLHPPVMPRSGVFSLLSLTDDTQVSL